MLERSYTGEARSSMSVMRSVLYALILREAVTRISIERGAWLWIMLEPGEHILFLMLWHGLIQHHLIPGINAPLFIGVGVLAFFMLRSVTTRGMDAISANMALFTYRQIKAVDAVIARAFLELFLYLFIAAGLVGGCAAFDVDVSIHDPLRALLGFALLWLLALGMALTFSVCAKLVPEVGQVMKMAFGPIYYMSATLYPSSWIPASAQSAFFMNPIVHGIEMIRGGFFEAYHEPDLVRPGYLALWALAFNCFGLLLQVRFGKKLVER